MAAGFPATLNQNPKVLSVLMESKPARLWRCFALPNSAQNRIVVANPCIDCGYDPAL
jgi:hypothetical protein